MKKKEELVSMKNKRTILFGGIALLVVVVVFLANGFISRGREARASQSYLQTAAVERGILVAQTGASGTVRSNQSAQITWKTSGIAGEVMVKVGERVSRGQELATLQPASLPQNVILAQADLISAQKGLDDLMNSKLQQAQAMQAVEEAQKALDDARNPDLRQAQAMQAVAEARKQLADAQVAHNRTHMTASQANIDSAHAEMILARQEYERALDNFERFASRPEDNLERAQAQSRLSNAQYSYERAVANYNAATGTANDVERAISEANLALAEAQLAEAQREHERLKDGATAAEIAILEARLVDAQREWQRLKDGPDPDDIAAAQDRIAAAQATLDLAHLSAPFEGVITQVFSKPGDQVSSGSLAFRLDDLSRLLVDTQVSEVDINQVQVGQAAILTFDSILGKDYHGQVVEVASVGEEQQGVVNFGVTVELADADDQVKPGMTAAVEITVSELSDVLLIPNRAVRPVDGERVVYVLRNGVSVAVPLSLGRSSDTQSEVLQGDLQVGDLIVLNPQAGLSQFGPGGQGGPGGNGPFGP